MMILAKLIQSFETAFLQQYGQSLLPSQRRALSAFKSCRNALSAQMKVRCDSCHDTQYVPHSCGHRHCPHCQAHQSQCWIERQQAKQLPCDYFLLTFTLPQQWRTLVWQHQTILYDLLMKSAWETVNQFSQNDRSLQGHAGAMAVLHTHNRRLDFHPHVHLLVPAGAFNMERKLWRTKKTKYLFNHKALAKVFRAKMLDGITQAGLTLEQGITDKWIVDCKQVGSGAKAIVYLGRYLYRGVIQEKDILFCDEKIVTFRYRESKTNQLKTRTLSGVEFLRLLLQHILPRGFRRARDFGFLHSNSKRMITLLQLKLRIITTSFTPSARPSLICTCCGGIKRVIKTRIDCRPMVKPKELDIPEGNAEAGDLTM